MSSQLPLIKSAAIDDAEAIFGFDHLALSLPARRTFILRAIAAGCCHVALVDGKPVAYGVLEYTFFESGFISMLYVASDHRHKGIGSALMRHMETACKTPKLFTSANRSNVPMQRLLHKLGFRPSGVIENLDEGDPELVFFKPSH